MEKAMERVVKKHATNLSKKMDQNLLATKSVKHKVGMVSGKMDSLARQVAVQKTKTWTP